MIQRIKNFLRSKTLIVGSTSKLSDVPVIKPKCIKDCPSPLILMKCEPILEDIEEEDDELAEVKTSVESPCYVICWQCSQVCFIILSIYTV